MISTCKAMFMRAEIKSGDGIKHFYELYMIAVYSSVSSGWSFACRKVLLRLHIIRIKSGSRRNILLSFKLLSHRNWHGSPSLFRFYSCYLFRVLKTAKVYTPHLIRQYVWGYCLCQYQYCFIRYCPDATYPSNRA